MCRSSLETKIRDRRRDHGYVVEVGNGGQKNGAGKLEAADYGRDVFGNNFPQAYLDLAGSAGLPFADMFNFVVHSLHPWLCYSLLLQDSDGWISRAGKRLFIM